MVRKQMLLMTRMTKIPLMMATFLIGCISCLAKFHFWSSSIRLLSWFIWGVSPWEWIHLETHLADQDSHCLSTSEEQMSRRKLQEGPRRFSALLTSEKKLKRTEVSCLHAAFSLSLGCDYLSTYTLETTTVEMPSLSHQQGLHASVEKTEAGA